MKLSDSFPKPRSRPLFYSNNQEISKKMLISKLTLPHTPSPSSSSSLLPPPLSDRPGTTLEPIKHYLKRRLLPQRKPLKTLTPQKTFDINNEYQFYRNYSKPFLGERQRSNEEDSWLYEFGRRTPEIRRLKREGYKSEEEGSRRREEGGRRRDDEGRRREEVKRRENEEWRKEDRGEGREEKGLKENGGGRREEGEESRWREGGGVRMEDVGARREQDAGLKREEEECASHRFLEERDVSHLMDSPKKKQKTKQSISFMVQAALKMEVIELDTDFFQSFVFLLDPSSIPSSAPSSTTSYLPPPPPSSLNRMDIQVNEENKSLVEELKKEHPNLFTDSPSGRQEVFILKGWILQKLKKILSSLKESDEELENRIGSLGICEQVILIGMNELFRQISIECYERGELVLNLWRSYLKTIEKMRSLEKKQNALIQSKLKKDLERTKLEKDREVEKSREDIKIQKLELEQSANQINSLKIDLLQYKHFEKRSEDKLQHLQNQQHNLQIKIKKLTYENTELREKLSRYRQTYLPPPSSYPTPSSYTPSSCLPPSNPPPSSFSRPPPSTSHHPTPSIARNSSTSYYPSSSLAPTSSHLLPYPSTNYQEEESSEGASEEDDKEIMALLGEERGSRFSVLEERKELENPIIIKCFAEAKEKIMMHKEVQTVNEKKKEDFAVQTDLNLISSKYDPLLNPTSIDDALSSLTIKQSVRRFSTMSIHRQGSLGKRESVVLNILNTLTVSHPLPHNESITSKDTDSDSDASEEEEVRRGRREEEGRKKEEEGRKKEEEGRKSKEEEERRKEEKRDEEEGSKKEEESGIKEDESWREEIGEGKEEGGRKEEGIRREEGGGKVERGVREDEREKEEGGVKEEGGRKEEKGKEEGILVEGRMRARTSAVFEMEKIREEEEGGKRDGGGITISVPPLLEIKEEPGMEVAQTKKNLIKHPMLKKQNTLQVLNPGNASKIQKSLDPTPNLNINPPKSTFNLNNDGEDRLLMPIKKPSIHVDSLGTKPISLTFLNPNKHIDNRRPSKQPSFVHIDLLASDVSLQTLNSPSSSQLVRSPSRMFDSTKSPISKPRLLPSSSTRRKEEGGGGRRRDESGGGKEEEGGRKEGGGGRREEGRRREEEGKKEEDGGKKEGGGGKIGGGSPKGKKGKGKGGDIIDYMSGILGGSGGGNEEEEIKEKVLELVRVFQLEVEKNETISKEKEKLIEILLSFLDFTKRLLLFLKTSYSEKYEEFMRTFFELRSKIPKTIDLNYETDLKESLIRRKFVKKAKNVTKFFLVPKLGANTSRVYFDKEANSGVVLAKKVREMGMLRNKSKLLHIKQVFRGWW